MLEKRRTGIFAQIILAAGGLLHPALAQTPEPAPSEKIAKLEARYAEDLKNGMLSEFMLEAVIAHDIDMVRFLLGKGVDPDIKYESKLPVHESMLMLAAHNNDTEILRALINAGADINRKDEEGETALTRALASGSYTSLEELLSHPHLDIYALDDFGRNLLRIAIDRTTTGDDIGLEKVLDHGGGALVNLRSNSDETPFSWALATYWGEAGHREIIDRLARAGGDPNTTRSGDANVTLLHDAAEKGKEEVVQLLIELGANLNAVTGKPNSADAMRDTPLMMAAKEGHTNIVEKLVFYNKARIDDRNKLGRTALMTAAINGRTDTVIALLNGGAKIDLKDNEGKNALALAQALQTIFPTAGIPYDPDFSVRIQKTIDLLKDVTDGKPVPPPENRVTPLQPPGANEDNEPHPLPRARYFYQRLTAFSRA